MREVTIHRLKAVRRATGGAPVEGEPTPVSTSEFISCEDEVGNEVACVYPDGAIQFPAPFGTYGNTIMGDKDVALLLDLNRNWHLFFRSLEPGT